jgi:hypothetical protein
VGNASSAQQAARWSHAALLEATGNYSASELAQRVGVAVKTVENWRSDPAYKAICTRERERTFAEVGERLRDHLVSSSLRVRDNRIEDYERVRRLALETIEARRADAKEQLARWQAYETRRQELLEFAEVCRVALLETDREDSEAMESAETDLKKAEGDLSFHNRFRGVTRPPREALTGAMARDIKSVGKEAVEVWKWDDGPLRTLMAADRQAAEDLGQWLQKLKLDVGELQDDQLLRLLAGEVAHGDPMDGVDGNSNPT